MDPKISVKISVIMRFQFNNLFDIMDFIADADIMDNFCKLCY